MRKTYRFSHTVCQGGYLYSHKISGGAVINDKEGLRNALMEVADEFKLLDVTIKVYDSAFFFFFMIKPSVIPLDVINSIQEKIARFGLWGKDYAYTGVYDLQEGYVRQELKRLGFDYDRG